MTAAELTENEREACAKSDLIVLVSYISTKYDIPVDRSIALLEQVTDALKAR
ncbi:hypothetical protein [Burkholderia phage BCSR5]|nr:hypothetical protein [Burkholderia phage BCSR5]